jgi:hypothetical protein
MENLDYTTNPSPNGEMSRDAVELSDEVVSSRSKLMEAIGPIGVKTTAVSRPLKINPAKQYQMITLDGHNKHRLELSKRA